MSWADFANSDDYLPSGNVLPIQVGHYQWILLSVVSGLTGRNTQ